jgi:putative nucleotidyltransferase with HDIG domain
MGNARELSEIAADSWSLVDLSFDPWEAHWKRMSAWSAELALAQGRQPPPHAHPLVAILDTSKGARLLSDLSIKTAAPDATAPKPQFDGLALAQAVDRHFAFEPFAEQGEEPDPFARYALDTLQCVSPGELDRAIAGLPVFPSAAQKALQLLMTDHWGLPELEFIGASDPVLAADLIRASNSCLFARREPITTLGQGIAYLGAERASAVLIAASVKRFFSTTRLREIWNHSLEASEIARNLARLSSRCNPEEAFLAGLVHDIGRLAMALLSDRFHERSARLMKRGCELSVVECALCGVSHAELGARALERWNFPRRLIDGVRFHHRPEASLSPVAAVLYLTERYSNPSEDMPSLARTKAAIDRLGLALDAPILLAPSEAWLKTLRL